MPYSSRSSYGYYTTLGYTGQNAGAGLRLGPGLGQRLQRGPTVGLEGALEPGPAREASREVRKDGQFGKSYLPLYK